MPRADFVSLELPDHLAQAIEALPVPPTWALDRYEPSHLHMTLVFMGDLLRRASRDTRVKLDSLLSAFESSRPEPIVFEGFSLFPPDSRNCLVARFQMAKPTLKRLVALQSGCYDLELTREKADAAKFVAHVTLGKFRGATSETLVRIEAELVSWSKQHRLPDIEQSTSRASVWQPRPTIPAHVASILDDLNHPAKWTGHDEKRYRTAEPLQKSYSVYTWDTDAQQPVAHELPFNFSWVVPGYLAGSSLLRSYKDLEALKLVGIKHIVTLLEQPPEWCKPLSSSSSTPGGGGLQFHFFPVDDRTPPTPEQVQVVINLIRTRREATLIHCKGGYGRTNTLLIAILMQLKKMPPKEAITFVQTRRQHMILSESQEAFLFQHADVLLADRDTPPPAASSSPPRVLVTPPASLKMILFVGFPASGKSTLSKHMEQHLATERVVRVNYDEQKGKVSETRFLDALKVDDQLILVDNCNLQATKRIEWVRNMLDRKKQHVWCVFIDTPFDECRLRIQLRTDHPTIGTGVGATSFLDANLDQLEEPTMSEGYDKLFRLSTQHDIDQFLRQSGFPPLDTSAFLRQQNAQYERQGLLPILKFPRTPHICDMGSMTSDDEVFSPEQVKQLLSYVLVVQEKIDGGSVGFSIQPKPGQEHWTRVCVQNRTHYIKSSDHPQYRPLDKWVAKHTDDLQVVLDEPEHQILYGEWLVMQHGLAYTHLPSQCIVYDRFDRRTGRELTPDQLAACLKGTGLSQVAQLVPSRRYASLDDLKDTIRKSKSHYRDGPPEGAYIRALSEDGQSIIMRGKIVLAGYKSGSAFQGRKSATQKILFNSFV